MFFKVAQKVNIDVGNFSEKICDHKLSKIAQSGHTAMNVKDSLKSGESRRINWPL